VTLTDERTTGGGSDWRRQRACRSLAPDELFPEDEFGNEPNYPPPNVAWICQACPVRAECLADGMNEEYGIFGGMTGYQRSLINRKRQRKSCPGCGSQELIIEYNHEICVACGVSWDIF
jgi:hypothetical protein